jgi:hypothetical protein
VDELIQKLNQDLDADGEDTKMLPEDPVFDSSDQVAGIILRRAAPGTANDKLGSPVGIMELKNTSSADSSAMAQKSSFTPTTPGV